jgi:HSP20 family molecular chaperone IbpA
MSGARYHRAEIYFGDFRRVVELPWEADDRGIRAEFRDGMLEIRIRALIRTAAPAEVVREKSR